MAYNNKNFLDRVREICKFAFVKYEQGRNDRSWKYVWKYHVHPVYHISLKTFRRYLKIYKKINSGGCRMAEG
jgi:hypothetical protein